MTSDSWTPASSFKILEITVCLAKSLVHIVTHKINDVLIMALSDVYYVIAERNFMCLM